MIKDTLLVLTHFFNWKFLVAFGCITAIGLTMPERYTKLFRSVRFNISLFLAIAVASAIGTLMPMEQGAEMIYHSWWFAILMGLMAFDVIVCKLRRMPMNLFGRSRPKRVRAPETPEHFLAKSKLKASLPVNLPPQESAAAVRSWLKREGLKFEEEPSALGPTFFAGRHRLQRWGDFVLHVSIVVALAGNLMGVMFGFEESLPVEEGKSAIMKNRPYEVTLHDFTVEYYKDSGAPSVYASDLEVKQEGKTLAKERIVVNEPLDIDRVRFYQASWGMTHDFRSARLILAGREVELRQGERFPIKGSPLSVRANQFLPSFAVDEEGRATTSDYEGKNPALQVDFLSGDKVQARIWLLKDVPHAAYRIAEDGTVAPAAPPPFHLLDVDPVLFSGIQVGYDPGAPLFWTGSIALMVGLCMHFYMHQRRLRVLVVKKGGGSDVMIGGWNSRTPEDFQKEFSDWVDGLRQALS